MFFRFSSILDVENKQAKEQNPSRKGNNIKQIMSNFMSRTVQNYKRLLLLNDIYSSNILLSCQSICCRFKKLNENEKLEFSFSPFSCKINVRSLLELDSIK